jgi:3-oxoacyl-[acyl-carrier protein] reductase
MAEQRARSPIKVDLDGRTALVTGASGMIGAAIARRLAEAGARLCVADLDGCADLAAELDALACPVDVSDPQAVARMARTALDGLGRIDCLVTAAGVTSTGAFETITFEEWERVQAINLRGVFLCDQAVIAPMKAQGFGRIVNIGSVLAKNGGNPRPWIDPAEQTRAANAAYGAAKAGVHALTLYLAKELAAHNITANVIAPGPIASPMTTRLPEALIRQIPLGRMGRAEEIAALAAVLCADEAGFVTGEIIDVNGGLWVD